MGVVLGKAGKPPWREEQGQEKCFLACQKNGCLIFRPLGDLCHAIESCVTSNGFRVVREFVGHGVGRRLHEEPQVPNYGRKGARPRLKEGMILAIEPMVNGGMAAVKILDDEWTVVTLDGKPSAHFEHTVLIGKGKAEVLTPRPRLIPVPPPAFAH